MWILRAARVNGSRAITCWAFAVLPSDSITLPSTTTRVTSVVSMLPAGQNKAGLDLARRPGVKGVQLPLMKCQARVILVVTVLTA